jgi:hypothetical protein
LIGRSGLLKDDRCDVILLAKDLIHQLAHVVQVLVADLYEARAAFVQYLPRQQQPIAQVGQVRVDAQLPGVAEGADHLRLLRQVLVAAVLVSEVARRSVLLSTGSRMSTRYLDAMLATVVTDFGYAPETRIMNRFCTENAGGWLSNAGLTWREHLLDNALVFSDPEPIVRYVLSCLPTFGIMPGDERYVEAGVRLQEAVQRDLAHMGGTIRDATRVGFYIVTT